MTPLDYADRGWYVFPCHSIVGGMCTCRKPDCSSPGKHPRVTTGVREATTDVNTIRQWMTAWPDANWALACGRRSDVVVIDVDPDKGGFESIDTYEQERQAGPLPPTLRARSGGGGRHFLFRYPRSGETIKNRVNWLPGIDIRSDGGYVILPQGTHISGGTYQWENHGTTMDFLPADVAASISTTRRATSGGDDDSLADSASILDGVPEGQRDDTLFRWACRLRRQHESDKDAGRRIVTTLILEAARNSNFPEDQALIKVEQAYLQDHSDRSTASSDGGRGLTDIGSAERYAEQHADKIKWVRDAKQWAVWEGDRWRWYATAEAAIALAKSTALSILDEAKACTDSDRRKDILKWAAASQNVSRVKAMVELAKSEPALHAASGDFDADPYLLNVQNGIVDLRTGLLAPHSPGHLLSRVAPYPYDPTATAPVWEATLQRCVQSYGPETADYLESVLGYSLFGYNPEQMIFFIIGDAATGKSKLVEAVGKVLGDYERTAKTALITRNRFGTHHDSEMLSLEGYRAVTLSETSSAMLLDTEMVKSLTGADQVSVRTLYAAREHAIPVTWTIVVGTNAEPRIPDWDPAIERRVVKIPSGPTIPKHERKPDLADDLMAEAPGILARLVRRAVEISDRGYRMPEPPEAVTVANNELAEEHDALKRLIREKLTPSPGTKVANTRLHETYKSLGGHLKTRAFYDELATALKVEDGFESVTRDARSFIGVSLGWEP